MTTVSGLKNNSQSDNNTTYRSVSNEKEGVLSLKKSKSVFGSVGKDKTVPLVSPPPIMHHIHRDIHGRFYMTDENPQNKQNLVHEVEDMETQVGKLTSLFKSHLRVY